jgi:hypothetical protein
MGWAYNTYVRHENCMKNLTGKPEEKNSFRRLSVDEVSF